MCRWCVCADQDPTVKSDINPGGSEQPNPFLRSLGSCHYDADGERDEQLGQGREAESLTEPGAMPEPLSVADTNPQDADIADTMPTPR